MTEKAEESQESEIEAAKEQPVKQVKELERDFAGTEYIPIYVMLPVS